MAAVKDYVGSYRLRRMLNSGKFAEVWEAKKDGEDERVCIKVLKADFVESREQLGYLRREYECGKEMHHENVVQIHELNISSDWPPHLLMEFFDAPNLKQLVWQGAGWVTPALPDIIVGMANGLAYFHRHGWVHRDIKPDNFLVSEDVHVKLIDFSIAQKLRTGLASILDWRQPVQGTRSYMSPEQIRGKGLDARSDLYSFGCMMYQLFSGKMPYTGDNADDLLTKHLRAPVPALEAANPDVHPSLSDLVARMMAKRKEDRPDNMSMFLREFDQVRVYRTRKRVGDASEPEEL